MSGLVRLCVVGRLSLVSESGLWLFISMPEVSVMSVCDRGGHNKSFIIHNLI